MACSAPTLQRTTADRSCDTADGTFGFVTEERLPSDIGADPALTIQPSFPHYRRQLAGTGAAFVALAGVLLLQGLLRGFRNGWGWGIATVISVLLAALLGLWYMRRARIDITRDEIAYVGFGPTRRWQRDALGRVIVVDRMIVPMAPRNHQWIVALDTDDRRMFQIAGGIWAEDDRRRLVETLGHEDRLTGDTTTKDVAARYPTALRWHQRRPYLSAVVIMVAILVICVPLVLLVQ